MSTAFALRNLADPTFLVFVSLFALIRVFSSDNSLLIYTLSYAFHAINLQAFIGRRYSVGAFIRHSVVLRAVGLGTLGLLMLPYLGGSLEPWALLPIGVGIALQVVALVRLGLERTYYGVELGEASSGRIVRFPYNYLQHPMAIGASLQFAGLYLLSPEFTSDYPLLVPGHFALTGITAVVEHFDWHLPDPFYRASRGTFTGPAARETIDRLRAWAFSHFDEHLNGERSMHRYVTTLPPDVVARIDRLRYSREILDTIEARFPGAHIVGLPRTDEICASRDNDNGDDGDDRGLFARSDEENVRSLPGTTVVRSLVYLSPDDDIEIAIKTSGTIWRMRTYDFGLIDLHREMPSVQAKPDTSGSARLFLQCNYFVDLSGFRPYRWLGILLDVAAIYVAKGSMKYGKSPTAPQKILGIACNAFRRLNSYSPIASMLLVLWLLGLSIGVFVARVVQSL
jgi:hypothetical protein